MLSELLRFFRRGADGAHHGGAHFAFFQFVQAFNRRAAGAGHLVFERAGMHAGFQNHFRAAQNGLRGKLRGHVARQSRRHAAVAQGLDELVNIRRPAAAQAGHGVEQRFLHLKREADGGKKFFRQLAIRRRRGFAERERRRARADERRRVGHHADDARAGGQRGFEFRERHAGGDGDEQMFFGERAANFRQRGGNLVGFGRQNQNAGEFCDFGVGRNGFCADLGGEMFARGVRRVAGDDFTGAGKFAANEAAGERGGHFARAEKADF